MPGSSTLTKSQPAVTAPSQIGDAVTRPTTCFRLKPYFRNLGATCTALLAAIGLGSVHVAYFNVDNSFPKPHLAATSFGLFWACFVVLSALLLLLHRQYRLWFNADSVRQRGLYFDRTLQLSSVTELRWRKIPAGGSVRLAGTRCTLKIELGNFTQSQRDSFIAHLREWIPEDRQSGWDEFQRQFDDSPRRLVRKRRVSQALSLLLAFHAVAFLVLWALQFGSHFLLASLGNLACLAYFRHQTRNQQPHSSVGIPSVTPESTI